MNCTVNSIKCISQGHSHKVNCTVNFIKCISQGEFNRMNCTVNFIKCFSQDEIHKVNCTLKSIICTSQGDFHKVYYESLHCVWPGVRIIDFFLMQYDVIERPKLFHKANFINFNSQWISLSVFHSQFHKVHSTLNFIKTISQGVFLKVYSTVNFIMCIMRVNLIKWVALLIS